MRRLPWFIQWSQCNPQGSLQEVMVRVGEDVMMDAEAQVTSLQAGGHERTWVSSKS